MQVLTGRKQRPAENKEWYRMIPNYKSMPLLSRYSKSQIKKRLKTYLSFVFVRHPLERILSAWRSKLQNANSPDSRNFIPWMRQMMKIKNSEDITFETSLRYVVKFQNYLDQHWRHIQSSCLPCVLNYHVIGKYETLREDVENIFRITGSESFLPFPTQNEKINHTNSGLLMKKYYQEIDPKLIRQVWNIYKVDSEMFDYNLNSSIEGLFQV